MDGYCRRRLAHSYSDTDGDSCADAHAHCNSSTGLDAHAYPHFNAAPNAYARPHQVPGGAAERNGQAGTPRRGENRD